MCENNPYTIHGKLVDQVGRCVHYHQNEDVVALKCGACQKYYACFVCHDECETHRYQAMDRTDTALVICGVCRHTLTYTQYQIQSCPYCFQSFNPNCALHHDIYFN
ncbi:MULTISPECIES: CHY zinc finger protein [Enterococcus]|uniref:CHY-type domain-containing protein n=1 Tax=Enterococcus sulfureus ATCC 49903 TaxID=1140003 RepID=S0L694_9ENTE|nr:CHY zinc finger protein [Enterococcus sulfureus]EOT46996.1 hypothetical protein OMY_01246 [Enterococcus sulfureus ATCC 49903]EOT83709.1 hypothetical protein I573_01434 [Enterococcus sulfureus ATCC 49903]